VAVSSASDLGVDDEEDKDDDDMEETAGVTTTRFFVVLELAASSSPFRDRLFPDLDFGAKKDVIIVGIGGKAALLPVALASVCGRVGNS